MSRNKRPHNPGSEIAEYNKGYADGMKAAFEESELDAYYAGVGYGKRQAGDKRIGFNNAEERRQFEEGIRERDNHFNAYRVKRVSLLERLFGIKPSPSKTISTKETAYDRVRRTSGGRKRVKKQREKTETAIFRLLAEHTPALPSGQSEKNKRTNTRTRKRRYR